MFHRWILPLLMVLSKLSTGVAWLSFGMSSCVFGMTCWWCLGCDKSLPSFISIGIIIQGGSKKLTILLKLWPKCNFYSFELYFQFYFITCCWHHIIQTERHKLWKEFQHIIFLFLRNLCHIFIGPPCIYTQIKLCWFHLHKIIKFQNLACH